MQLFVVICHIFHYVISYLLSLFKLKTSFKLPSKNFCRPTYIQMCMIMFYSMLCLTYWWFF